MSKADVNGDEPPRETQHSNPGGGGKSTTTAKEDLPTPPDGGYGWVVVFAAFMINVIVDGVAYSYGVFIANLQEQYESSAGITSMVGSLLNGMYLLSSPLAGFLINRYDNRLVTICGSLIATLGFSISQLSPTIDVLMITFGLIGGFGFGMMYLPAVVSVSFYFEKRRALTTGIVVCGTGVGCFAFAPLLSSLMLNMGWKYAMVMVAGITLHGAVFGALLRPLKSNAPRRTQRPPPHSVAAASPPPPMLKAKEEEAAAAAPLRRQDDDESGGEQQKLDPVHGARQPGSKSPSVASVPVVVHGSTIDMRSTATLDTKAKRSWLQMTGLYLLSDPLFLIPILANLVAMLGHYIPFFYIVQRSVNMLDIPQSQAAYLLSVIAITNTLGRILMGFLADFKQVNSLLLHNIAIATSGVACILTMVCLNFASTAVFAAYFGLCMAAWISLSPIILCELLGLEKLTNAFGLLCFVRGISSFAGPPIAGMVYDTTKDYNNAFHVGGILLIIGGLIAFLLHLPFLQRRTYANKMRQHQKEQLASAKI